MKRVAVLASGRGSNLGALIAAQALYPSFRVTVALSNVESSGSLALARQAGVEALCVPSQGLAREVHEDMLGDALKARSIDIICLAGYMRVLTPAFIDAVTQPVLNIHPSLLPSFPGMHAQRQAVEAGVRWSGATVHFVDAGLDSGPILLQEPVQLRSDDTESELAARILAVEHRLFPQAVDIVARGAYDIWGRVVRLRSPVD